ncbi:MAG: hypothetical protein KFH87_08920 [Bacteroidetes bacterium]|nr:hypothetical protein [Bacteroidota bacterium]
MATKNDKVQSHPANAVFALMDDRQFRYSVIRPALEEDKATISRLATGKHQLKGFRNISRAPMSMLLPVISDEANLSAEMARRILDRWFTKEDELKSLVAAKLQLLGYEPKEAPFDEEGNVEWQMLAKEHADMQYDGTFIEDQDENAVMLMSLLLGWFGADDDAEEEDEATDDTDETSS